MPVSPLWPLLVSSHVDAHRSPKIRWFQPFRRAFASRVELATVQSNPKRRMKLIIVLACSRRTVTHAVIRPAAQSAATIRSGCSADLCWPCLPPDFFFSSFFKKFHKYVPGDKIFKIWTLSLTSSLLAPSLHCSTPSLLAPRSRPHWRNGS